MPMQTDGGTLPSIFSTGDTISTKSRNTYLSLLSPYDAWRGNRETTDETLALYLCDLYERGKTAAGAQVSCPRSGGAHSAKTNQTQRAAVAKLP